MSEVQKTIVKRVLADRIAQRLEVGQAQTLQVIQALLDEIINELAMGNRLEFRDFGVFETVERKPRTALNPKTLDKVDVPKKVVAKFKPGRLMKERVAELGGTVCEQTDNN
ncbi:MAG: HU family DNA-binding protein [Planctomycetota bacterium]